MRELSDDLLRGAGAIAKFLLGADTKQNRRRVFHLHQHGHLPSWREGRCILTRKSLLEQHYTPPSEAAE